MFQYSDLAQFNRLDEIQAQLEKHIQKSEEAKRAREVEKIIDAHEKKMRFPFPNVKVKAHITLQELWVNKDMTCFSAWLDEEQFSIVLDTSQSHFKYG